jgi:hypothetical protein
MKSERINMTATTTVESASAATWRPPGWRDGVEDPYAPDEGHTIENVFATLDEFEQRRLKDEKGYPTLRYYTSEYKLTEAGQAARDSQTAEDVAHNVALLRDTWNTPACVWRLASVLLGVEFKVDPFWNPSTQGLPHLVRMLDGQDGRDGFAVLPSSNFPAHWRGDLPKGEAPAAANGPHSDVQRWLRCCAVYGLEEFCAAVVPDRGNVYAATYLTTAQIIVRLGRVPFVSSYGMGTSTPTGPTLLGLWVPPYVNRSTLPESTQRVLAGSAFRTPLWAKPKSRDGNGYHFVEVQPGELGIIDLGMVEGFEIAAG